MSQKTVFVNATIYSMDRKSAGARAIAVEDGKITAIGGNAEIKPLAKRGFTVIDLKKKTVIPGIIDSHLHLLSLGNNFKRVNLDGIDSLPGITEKIRKAAAKLSGESWLLGRGWNKNLWGETFPDKTLLDEITSNPVALYSKDGHLLWVNSTALKIAGLDRSTPDPPGGLIERDHKGEPTGILKENAADLVDDIIPRETFADKTESIRLAQEHLLSLGITGAGDCDGDKDIITICHDLDQRKKLRLRIFKMISSRGFQRALDFKFHTGLGTEHFRIGCLKLFADGALGSQTALMFKPYEGSMNNYGVQTLSQDEIEDYVRRAFDAGISVAIHAIGDKANYQALSGIGKYSHEFRKRNLRPRIEHAQVLRKSDTVLFSRYGIIPSVQPIHATSDRDIADRYWGARSRYAYPFKTFLGLGAHLAFGSDAPIETADPIAGIYAAVTRKRQHENRTAWYPDEKITARQAVHAYTSGSAYACCFDDITGSISVGKRADFVALSDDIFEVKPDKISDIRVLMTVIDGSMAFGGI